MGNGAVREGLERVVDRMVPGVVIPPLGGLDPPDTPMGPAVVVPFATGKGGVDDVGGSVGELCSVVLLVETESGVLVG
jgi:hypothetical protein